MHSIDTVTDRADIADVIARFACTQDTRDWAGFHGLLDVHVHLDVSRHLDIPVTDLSAEQFTANTSATLEGFTSTHHTLANLVIAIEDDRARCHAHVTAHHHIAEQPSGSDVCVMRGYWQLGLRQAGGRWVVDSMTVVRTSPLEGNPQLYALAAARGRS